VLLAGPGSGKTKTLTIKLARILSEDVAEPRGAACITYNNECARELETRLEALGVEAGGRVFVGTVHSFSLTEIIIPYAKSAGLGLPKEFKVASKRDQAVALERAYNRVIRGPENPQAWSFRMGRHRRSILNRDSAAWKTQDSELSRLVEAYEDELRVLGTIDFDDMPLLAVRALRQHAWLQRAMLAKFPALVVDEYQDLGRALHGMVMGLCFTTGIRLFAVGDADQSVYGFTGAHPELLERVAARDDVETIHLQFNYRCGSQIVTASEYALGEVRGYKAPPGAHEGTIYFYPLHGSYEDQAEYLFSTVFAALFARISHLQLGDIAILYPAAWIGDVVARAAQARGHGFVRADTNALYPRSSRLMRWLEQCAIWSCSGWRSGDPRFLKLVRDGSRLFSEHLVSDDLKFDFRRRLLAHLWNQPNGALPLCDWLRQIDEGLLGELFTSCRTLSDEAVTLRDFIERTGPKGDASAMTLEQFAGDGDGSKRINLSTLHSSKGREFEVVILFGIDEGRIPRNNPSQSELRESRRVFYVGFTRAEEELHILYSAARQSRFVREVRRRMGLDEPA